MRAAGAAEVMVASPYHYALIRSLDEPREPTLAELLARMSPADLTLVEGFRREAIPRLEVYRPSLGKLRSIRKTQRSWRGQRCPIENRPAVPEP